MNGDNSYGIMITIVALIISIFCFESTICLANSFDDKKSSSDYCLYSNAIQFVDTLIYTLYISYNDNSIRTRESSWKCDYCDSLIESLEDYIKNICDSCCSKQRKRLLQQVVDYYNQLDSLVVKKDNITITQKGKKIASEPAVNIFWEVYFSILALKPDIEAVFRDSVPDNKALYDELLLLKNEQTNCCSTIATISQTVDSIKKIVSTMATGSFVAWGDTLKILSTTVASLISQVTTMSVTVAAIAVYVSTLTTTVTSIASMVDSTATLVDSVLKILNGTASTSCIVIGLAYYASSVVGGLVTWCPHLSSDISGTLTGEVLDYHEPVTSTSRIGLKLGIGGLIFKKYNISVGYIYFDNTLDPNRKRDMVHRIHISFDYWRSKDISFGIGYSALTGLGGRVLLGL